MNFRINEGDEISTICYYDVVSSDMRFGLDSDQEMCIVFVMYYPLQEGLEFCDYLNTYPGAPGRVDRNQVKSFDSVDSFRTFPVPLEIEVSTQSPTLSAPTTDLNRTLSPTPEPTTTEESQDQAKTTTIWVVVLCLVLALGICGFVFTNTKTSENNEKKEENNKKGKPGRR